MPLSYTRLTADGTTDVFTFPFSYHSEKDLAVFVNGMPASFEHINRGTVRLTQPLQTGEIIEIHRKTAVTELAQDYTGAGISKEALKNNAEQVLHKLQELEESSLAYGPLTIEMKGRRLTYIAAPIHENDATSRAWVENKVVEGQQTLSEHVRQAEASAVRSEEAFKKSEELSTLSQEFAKATEDQTLKLMTEMSEKASLLDKIIQIETQLSNNAQTYEEALLLQKQEFLERLEEEKESLSFQERSAQGALETLETSALKAHAVAQENKDLLIAERVKAVMEISELMGRHKVLLETCDSKEKSLQERITQETSALKGKVTAATSLLEDKLKETITMLDQKMEQALTTCQTVTTGVNDILKTQLTEKAQETLEALTKARLASVGEVSELLGRIKMLAEEVIKDREAVKSMQAQINRALHRLTDGEVTQGHDPQNPDSQEQLLQSQEGQNPQGQPPQP